MATNYRVTKSNGESFTVEGDEIASDGLGTRVMKEGKIVWTTPGQAEVVPVDSVVKADAADTAKKK